MAADAGLATLVDSKIYLSSACTALHYKVVSHRFLKAGCVLRSHYISYHKRWAKHSGGRCPKMTQCRCLNVILRVLASIHCGVLQVVCVQGILRGYDQATNLILDECHERVYSSKVRSMPASLRSCAVHTCCT